MSLRLISLASLSLAAAVGCETVNSAREAQRGVSAAANESTARAQKQIVKVDLHGVPLRGLVEFALTNRPSMVSAALAVKDARIAMREIAADAPLVSATPWNALHASASARYSESSAQASLNDLRGTERGKAAASISLDLLLWDFGRNSALAQAQAERVLAAEVQMIDAGYAVFDQVSECYFTLLQNDTLLEVAHTNVAKTIEHLKAAQHLFDEGMAKELDIQRARLDVAMAKDTLVSVSNEVLTAEANLMTALGINADVGNAASILGERGISTSSMIGCFAPTKESAEELFAFASTNAPTMRVARAQLRAASSQVDYAVASLYPELSASLSLNWTDPLWYWGWGVSAAEQLFTGGRRTAAIDRAVVAMESAKANVDYEEQLLSYELARAVAERDNAAVAVTTAAQTLKEAAENLRMLEQQHEVGEASRLDLTDALNDYVAALGSRVKAFYRGQIAEAKLFAFIGIDPVYDEKTIQDEQANQNGRTVSEDRPYQEQTISDSEEDKQ